MSLAETGMTALEWPTRMSGAWPSVTIRLLVGFDRASGRVVTGRRAPVGADWNDRGGHQAVPGFARFLGKCRLRTASTRRPGIGSCRLSWSTRTISNAPSWSPSKRQSPGRKAAVLSAGSAPTPRTGLERLTMSGDRTIGPLLVRGPVTYLPRTSPSWSAPRERWTMSSFSVTYTSSRCNRQ